MWRMFLLVFLILSMIRFCVGCLSSGPEVPEKEVKRQLDILASAKQGDLVFKNRQFFGFCWSDTGRHHDIFLVDDFRGINAPRRVERYAFEAWVRRGTTFSVIRLVDKVAWDTEVVRLARTYFEKKR